jgi:transcriptional regulator with XRE-family HTH domain
LPQLKLAAPNSARERKKAGDGPKGKTRPGPGAKAKVRSLAATESVGQKLRHRRVVRRMSLNDVAEKAGLSIALLSQIERGLSTPSLRSLNQICEALDMPMRWLFDADGAAAAGEETVVVRSANRRCLDLGQNSGMSKEILSTDAVPQLQLMRFVLHPGLTSGVSPSPHPTGAKAGTVLAGQLWLEVNGREYVLNRGDSFSFHASSAYRFACFGDVDCEMIWAVTPALY